MTTAELRAAAERLFNWSRKHAADVGRVELMQLVSDSYHVAQSYLAEHPGYDDLPTTADDHATIPHEHGSMLIRDGKLFFVVEKSARIPIDTKGQLRQLVAALKGES